MKYFLSREKWGSSATMASNEGFFRMEDCGLQDSGCKGDPSTRCNKRKGDDIIFARLDWFVCNLDWNIKYPTAVVKNLDFWGSYHRPILLNMDLVIQLNLSIKPKRFSFEHIWLLEEDFTNYVKWLWEGRRMNVNLPTTLFQCIGDLKN